MNGDPAGNQLDAGREMAFGLWVGRRASDIARLRDLTLSWTRFGYQGLVVESDSLEDILQRCAANGYRACLVQSPGHILSEDWVLPHWEVPDLHALLQSAFDGPEFLVCADWREEDGEFALESDCMLIDLTRYIDLGRPAFGSAGEQPVQRWRQRVCRSAEVEAICAGEVQEAAANTLDGWNFIDASLRAGLVVPRLPKRIAGMRLSLLDRDGSMPLPIIGNDILISETRSSTEPVGLGQQRFLRGVRDQLRYGRSGVFLWNIESYGDVPLPQPANSLEPKALRQATDEPVDRLYCVAAGFKPNMLLHRLGFNSETHVCFFDYSDRALEIRRTLIEEWDGRDYPSFCRDLIHEFPPINDLHDNDVNLPAGTYYQLWNGISPDRIDWDDVRILWQAELKRWGSEDVFRRQWLAQRELSYQYLHCDVVADPAPLLSVIEQQESGSGGTVIWWSNAFFTVASNWLMSIADRREHYREWIYALAERCPAARLFGADYINVPVNNIASAEYAAGLGDEQYVHPSHDLFPNPGRSLPLRF